MAETPRVSTINRLKTLRAAVQSFGQSTSFDSSPIPLPEPLDKLVRNVRQILSHQSRLWAHSKQVVTRTSN